AHRPRAESDWLVSVTHATARLVVASSSFALEHLAPVSGSVTAAICTDDKVERWPAKGSTGILVAPPEARVFDEKEPTSERVYIPFHQRYPMTFGLLTDGIELPTSY
ncbi:MAG TPA: hypothetical protein VD789_02795, partial [Thermomicrobiales bacterium]|nr:hypothetical protein [Thermomicrobiales bacterium]